MELPVGWSKQFSKTHQRDYWFNAADGTRSWEPPNSNQKMMNEEEEEEEEEKNCGKAKRARTSPQEAAVVINEDSPNRSLERARLLGECFEVFVSENSKFGNMRGNSKTAKSCMKDGMRVGMQGIFGRVVWTQLLRHVQTRGDIGTDPCSDAVIVHSPVVDEAVTNELIEAGRTPHQAQVVMNAVSSKFSMACAALVQMHSSLKAGPLPSSVALQGKLKEDGKYHDSVMYRLTFGGTSHTISGTHLQKLLKLYRTHTLNGCTSTEPTFLRRVFCVLARYELLSGTSDGYQMAFPDVGFKWLRDRVGVTAECFASPLNCWNDRFCSVARDTDHFFGSMGNFFHFSGAIPPSLEGEVDPQGGGSFEANPPFVESIMNEMAGKIEEILSVADGKPFSFVVVVPAWKDCLGIDIMTNSKHLRPHPKYVLCLEKKKHNYRPGMQHRTEHAEQPSNVDTLVFFLQNDAGARRWPVSVSMAEELNRVTSA